MTNNFDPSDDIFVNVPCAKFITSIIKYGKIDNRRNDGILTLKAITTTCQFIGLHLRPHGT